MVYRKHPPESRKYKKSESHSKDHNSHSHKEEHDLPSIEPVSFKEKKSPPPFSFLTSLFGSSEKAERSGEPLFSVFEHDVYLDDLLLVGLIFLLLTDKIDDEILLIILVYLLLDIF
ncbi:MAG TPA: hypothetical protein VIK78_20940 [Ruminiclostridium sp.]